MLIYYFGFQLNSNCLQDWQQLFMFPRWSYIFMALTWDRGLWKSKSDSNSGLLFCYERTPKTIETINVWLMKYHNKYIISLHNCLYLSVHNSVGIFLLNTISSQCLRILSIVFLVKHSLILENISHCIPRGFSKNIVMLILYLLSCGTLYIYIYDTAKCAHYSSTYCAVLFFSWHFI